MYKRQVGIELDRPGEAGAGLPGEAHLLEQRRVLGRQAVGAAEQVARLGTRGIGRHRGFARADRSRQVAGFERRAKLPEGRGSLRRRGGQTPGGEDRREERDECPPDGPQTPGIALFSGLSTRTRRSAVASDIVPSTPKNVECFHSVQ